MVGGQPRAGQTVARSTDSGFLCREPEGPARRPRWGEELPRPRPLTSWSRRVPPASRSSSAGTA